MKKTTKAEAEMKDALPWGTKVVSTVDGEPGTIMGGFAQDGTGEWVEYEVSTQYDAKERWLRSEFMTMAEIDEATKE